MNKPSVPHPSSSISADLAGALRGAGARAEALRRLHPEQLSVIHDQQWFRLFVPQAYGGLHLSLPEALRLEEAIAWSDGSSGWVITLCAGASWFSGFLDPALAREIFSDPLACVAGSGAVGGTAEEKDGGYVIRGAWQHASGALHATVFTANCYLHRHGKLAHHPDGSPCVKAFLLRKEEVVLHPSWHSMGMVATASLSFEVPQVRVPGNRAFVIDGPQARLSDPAFQYPFLPFSEATLAVNLSGMAVRFLDLCGEVISARGKRDASQSSSVGSLWQQQRRALDGQRLQLFDVVDRSWEELISTQAVGRDVANRVSCAAHGLAACSLAAVSRLYPFCGIGAADEREEINRVWRNLFTASQHSLFRSGLSTRLDAEGGSL